MLDVRFADTGGDELFTISPRRLLPLVMLVLGLGGGFVGMAGTFGDSCPVAGQYMAGGGACAIVASVCSVASWLWLDGKSAESSRSKTGAALAIIGTTAQAFAAALTIDAGLMLFTLLADAQTCFVKDPGSGGLAPASMVKALGLPAGLMILSCIAVLAQLARAAVKAMCGGKGARKATGASENTGLLARLKLFAGGEAEPTAAEEEARGACGVAAPTGRGALDLLLICTVVGLLSWAMFFVIAHAGGGGICPVSDVTWHCGASGEGKYKEDGGGGGVEGFDAKVALRSRASTDVGGGMGGTGGMGGMGGMGGGATGDTGDTGDTVVRRTDAASAAYDLVLWHEGYPIQTASNDMTIFKAYVGEMVAFCKAWRMIRCYLQIFDPASKVRYYGY